MDVWILRRIVTHTLHQLSHTKTGEASFSVTNDGSWPPFTFSARVEDGDVIVSFNDTKHVIVACDFDATVINRCCELFVDSELDGTIVSVNLYGTYGRNVNLMFYDVQEWSKMAIEIGVWGALMWTCDDEQAVVSFSSVSDYNKPVQPGIVTATYDILRGTLRINNMLVRDVDKRRLRNAIHSFCDTTGGFVYPNDSISPRVSSHEVQRTLVARVVGYDVDYLFCHACDDVRTFYVDTMFDVSLSIVGFDLMPATTLFDVTHKTFESKYLGIVVKVGFVPERYTVVVDSGGSTEEVDLALENMHGTGRLVSNHPVSASEDVINRKVSCLRLISKPLPCLLNQEMGFFCARATTLKLPI